MENKKLTRMWPIIEPDDRIPLPPVAWAALNVMALTILALPFAVLVGAVCLGMMALNQLHVFLDAHFAHGALVVSITVNTLKVFMGLLAFRFASIIVDTLPWVISEGRAALLEYDRP
jgi:hypothetical protein